MQNAANPRPIYLCTFCKTLYLKHVAAVWTEQRIWIQAGAEIVEETSEEQAHNILWHQVNCTQGIRPGRPSSHFHTALEFYGDCSKTCVDLAPKFGDNPDCYITTKHGIPF
jgi:hypothetical protein